MDGISHAISKQWVGLILLPGVTAVAGAWCFSSFRVHWVLSNAFTASECMTAVNVSVKDQLTLSISVAVGSTIVSYVFVVLLHSSALTPVICQQTALFVIP